MKIFELFEDVPTVTAPGNVVAPVGPGVKPSGSQPVPNTEKKPETSNTPDTPQQQPANTNNANVTQQPNANGQPAQPMGADTSQPLPQQQQVQPAQNTEESLSAQDFKSQMQSLMMKLQQIQGQEPPPDSENPQPGVS